MRLKPRPYASGIGDEPAHREQTRHVALRLLRQLQAPEIDWLALGQIVRDGASHVGFTAVVRSNREQPVAIELVVQKLQVVDARVRLDDVVARGRRVGRTARSMMPMPRPTLSTRRPRRRGSGSGAEQRVDAAPHDVRLPGHHDAVAGVVHQLVVERVTVDRR